MADRVDDQTNGCMEYLDPLLCFSLTLIFPFPCLSLLIS